MFAKKVLDIIFMRLLFCPFIICLITCACMNKMEWILLGFDIFTEERCDNFEMSKPLRFIPLNIRQTNDICSIAILPFTLSSLFFLETKIRLPL